MNLCHAMKRRSAKIALVVFVWLALLMPVPEFFSSAQPAFAQNSSSSWQRTRQYMDFMRRQQIARENAERQRRAQEAQRRREAEVRRLRSLEQARIAREKALLQQKASREQMRTREEQLRRQNQTQRMRRLQEKRAKERHRLRLNAFLITRLQAQARLNSLPKPSGALRSSSKPVLARLTKEPPKRPTMKTHRCSFHGDTLVLTEVGMIPIRDIEVGVHRVWAMDEFTGETSWKDVLAQYSNEYDETVYVSIFDPDSMQTQTIISNRIHPFFGQMAEYDNVPLTVAHQPAAKYAFIGNWIEAANLAPGVLLLSSDGTWDEVVSVSVKDNALQAFNLSVDEFQTFFVSADVNLFPLWVHNTCLQAALDKKLRGLDAREQRAVIIEAQRDYAAQQGWTRDRRLEALNPNRRIYRTRSGEIRSADRLHGHWEKLDARGRHLGAVGLGGETLDGRSGARDPSGDHDILVK